MKTESVYLSCDVHETEDGAALPARATEILSRFEGDVVGLEFVVEYDEFDEAEPVGVWIVGVHNQRGPGRYAICRDGDDLYEAMVAALPRHLELEG